ncbi:MAG: hypothetical protein LBV79_04105 [Candidatus Adiutrix sp.]|jgi:septal ring factor EnvC (AmiA/AmiB activator)|nr:hypothetical protein [Candidatus Adiutrix sp.]
MDKIKLAAAVLAVTAVAWLAIGNAGLRADLAQRDADIAIVEKDLAMANQAVAAYAREVNDNRLALELRETERAQLLAERKALTDKLEEVYANDPTSKAWAATLCPLPVFDSLRQ